MLRLLLRRLLVIPAVMLLANMTGFIYAYILGPIQERRAPSSFESFDILGFLRIID